MFERHLDPVFYRAHRERLGDLSRVNKLGGEEACFAGKCDLVIIWISRLPGSVWGRDLS